MASDQALTIPIAAYGASCPTPAYAHVGDAAVDLRASCSGSILPGQRALIPCGFMMALPEGFAGLVLPRSGLAANHGVTVLNAPGLIDSSYRGEVKVCLVNTDECEPFEYSEGDRIAQLLVIPYPTVVFKEVDALSQTDRGAGGFGSSGIG